ncbi:hypothetical protein KSS93_19230 [Pseudomonas xanthosomatis]|uniref:hypothetical protein n=1 Tax=Pseudomonas xanthosomatis TaxID=2842356 RepID=UPI001C3E5699|nr:hypothetical protein [Pseudomonas xanthosomatis]QXH49004.1 hypothetical protein KSS93_19230 [Pseudomonas xanthosomatis]
MQTTQRSIGPWSLMLTGLGSIIGSGWLFGAWHASAIAGPAAILAWIIGAVVVLAMPAMALLSYLGSQAFGGIGVLGEGWDMLAVALVALGFYHFGVRSGYRTRYLAESVVWRQETSQHDSTEPMPATPAQS